MIREINDLTIAERGEPYVIILKTTQNMPEISILNCPCNINCMSKNDTAGNTRSRTPNSMAVLT